MLTKMFSSVLVLSCILSAGCVSHYRPEVVPANTLLSPQENSQVASYKFNVPCRISVNASDDMVGQNKSIWDSTPFGYKDLYHYPLRALLNDCFNSVVYCSFEQPKGNVVDSFELQIEPQSSLLSVDGDNTRYKLVLYVTLYEPGGKKVISWSLDRTNFGSMKSHNEIPDVVYKTIKEIAMEVIKKISTDNKVMVTVSRYSEK